MSAKSPHVFSGIKSEKIIAADSKAKKDDELEKYFKNSSRIEVRW